MNKGYQTQVFSYQSYAGREERSAYRSADRVIDRRADSRTGRIADRKADIRTDRIADTRADRNIYRSTQNERVNHASAQTGKRIQKKQKAEGIRRMICSIAVMLVIAVIFFILSGFSGVNHERESLQQYYTPIMVNAQDSLWTIAQSNLGPGYTSVNEYIRDIKDVNDMKSNTIYSGQILILPYYA